MLITERDWKRGGERFAIPTIGEIQGRLVVSEVVALECLGALLASKQADTIRSVKKAVFVQLKRRCAPFALSKDEQEAAMGYARELFEAALAEARTPLAQPPGRSADG